LRVDGFAVDLGVLATLVPGDSCRVLPVMVELAG
jgi:hypothetical protein